MLELHEGSGEVGIHGSENTNEFPFRITLLYYDIE
jgi:hypothetical protein